MHPNWDRWTISLTFHTYYVCPLRKTHKNAKHPPPPPPSHIHTLADLCDKNRNHSHITCTRQCLRRKSMTPSKRVCRISSRYALFLPLPEAFLDCHFSFPIIVTTFTTYHLEHTKSAKRLETQTSPLSLLLVTLP